MKLEESEKGDSGGPVVRGEKIPGTFDRSQKLWRNLRDVRKHDGKIE